MFLLAFIAGAHGAAAEADACDLGHLFQKYGTDKLPVHHYQRAYCPLLEPYRERARIVVELGFLRGQGCAAFAEYFKNASVFGVDNGEYFSLEEVPEPDSGEMVPGHHGKPLKLGPRRKHVHLFKAQMQHLETKFHALRELGRGGRAGLPTHDIDVLIDDADHFKSTQIANFRMWFPRLAGCAPEVSTSSRTSS